MDEVSLYDSFFKKFQRELLLIVNSDAGRSLFQIPEKEKIVKISPNSYHIELDKGLYRTTFRCYELYAGIIHGGFPSKKLKSENSILPFVSHKHLSLTPFFHLPMLSQDTYYTGAGDGYVGLHTNDGSPKDGSAWTAHMNAATGSIADYTSATAYVGITQNQFNNQLVYRAHWPFTTSSLDNTSNVDSGTFKLYGYANYSDTDGKTVYLIESTQPVTTEITTADYNNFVRGVALSDTNIALHLSNSAYNNWPLNATGISKIDKNGVTKYGTVISPDFDGGYTSGPACGHSVHTSEASGTANDPILVLNYSNYQGGTV